jgi:sugar/nucleoside kinase (ribokinase family)
MIDQYEASTLAGVNNLKDAGLKILEAGVDFVVIKKGEHGALIFNKNYEISIPGYLTNIVKDPTGAGDSFAGTFFGYLDKIGNEYNSDNIFIATVLATVVASHTVEGFGTEALLNLNIDNIYERYEKYIKLIGQNTYISLDNLKSKLEI